MRTIYQKQDEMILYHYCDYSDQRTLNSSNIAKSLVRQILDKKSFSDSLFERLEKLSSEKGPSWIDDEELLRICLCSLRRYMVVLDGIDELSGGERTKFHYKLSKILKENKNVKVLVSCRKGELQLGQRFPVTHHLDITKDKVADVGASITVSSLRRANTLILSCRILDDILKMRLRKHVMRPIQSESWSSKHPL